MARLTQSLTARVSPGSIAGQVSINGQFCLFSTLHLVPAHQNHHFAVAPGAARQDEEGLGGIRRIWRSYTTPDKAEAYEHFFDTLVQPAIEGLKLPGYQNMELLRREANEEVEFIWVMNFDSMKTPSLIKAEADDQVSVPRAAQQLLTRWDEKASFYETRSRQS